MPIHDWSRASAGGFHNFHQDWTVALYPALNGGLLPDGLFAYIDLRMSDDPDPYARKANRISIRHEFGRVVAIIEVVSPGNKDTRHALASFVDKAVEFLQSGVSLVVVDLFPPSVRDPQGIHRAIWDALTDEPSEPRPPDKPLTVVSYDPGDPLTAYLDPLAVGDELPDAPLFLAPNSYITLPLEATYQTCWAGTPGPIRNQVG